MHITADKRGGHWPARASQKFGGGGGGANPNTSPPIEKKKLPKRRKRLLVRRKSPPPQHGEILYDFLGGSEHLFLPPPCGRPF